MASAGVPRAVSAQEGKPKEPSGTRYTLGAFKTLNLIQIKSAALRARGGAHR